MAGVTGRVHVLKGNTFYSVCEIYSALQKYWNSKDKIPLLAVESRHLKKMIKRYETKILNVTFYYWVIQHIDVIPAKKFSTFRVSSPYLM